MTRERGFSLLEVVVATALMLGATAAAFTTMHPAHGAFAVEPEKADMQQRLRVAADVLSHDLMMAGAGAYQGLRSGPLVHYFPPVLPFRQGATNEDPPGTFAADRITTIYVPATPAQTTLTAPLAAASPVFSPGVEIGCPHDASTDAPAPLCGFRKDQTVLVFDATGNYNLFTITAASGGIATLAVNAPAHRATSTFAPGSKIVEAVSHTYYLRTDAVSGGSQLMRYDGSANAGVPVVDHVVGLRFDYYGEPQPPTMRPPAGDPRLAGSTYGPSPIEPGVASCLFSDGTSPVALLPVLGDGTQALVPVGASELTDGPFCPGDGHDNRWDADLLRIRRIAVTVRVQTAVSALRGPAGDLFSRGGTSNGGARWLPDQEIHFDVSPRNLDVAR